MKFRNIAVIFAVLVILLFATASAFATTYKISGSSDGTGTFVVDDGLTVYLNGIQIYSDGNASSGARQPIQFNANVGDQLRFAVHDTYGDCRSLSRLVLTDSAGRFAVIFNGWSGGCGNAIDTGEVFSQTVAIPVLPPREAYLDKALPGNAYGGLVAVPDGRLFGVTYNGGDFNKGTLYYFDTAAACDQPGTNCYAVVHHFTGGTDGSVPYHELVYDPASNKLYGTTSAGSGGGTIFSYNPSNNEFATVISDFQGRSAPQRQLVVSNNYIYGVLQYGNQAGNPVVFRVATNGTGFTPIHEFAEYGAMPQNVVLGTDNILYGVNIGGGGSDCYPAPQATRYCGQVFSLNLDGSGFQVLKQFERLFGGPCTVVADCANSPQALIYGSDGNLYGATYNSIFRMDPHGSDPASTIQFLYTANNNTNASLIEGSDGRLYAAYYGGGAIYGTGQIFSMNRDGSDRIVHKEFTTAAGSAFGPYGKLFRDSFGNIYGTTEYEFVNNSLKGRVFFIAAGGVHTPGGTNVPMQWANASLLFSNVTSPGVTSVTEIDPSSVDASLPVGYAVVPGTVAYEIKTTATFTGNVTVCIAVPNVNDEGVFSTLSLLHGEGGVLVDVTSSRDFATRTICGVVTSLSPFVIGQPAGATPTPTPSPTPSPTPEPTPDPTPEPTPDPTPDPTPEPTPDPTPEPTATPSPTATPTATPTPSPTPTPAPTAPAAPSNLVATALSGSEILLSWSDNANNEANFELERCDGKGKCKLFKLLASPSTNSVNYLDTGLTVATQYSYRIRATNEVGNSAYSNIAKAKSARR
jgi:uncharacterized repeat protein (TIGR03803 family)